MTSLRFLVSLYLLACSFYLFGETVLHYECGISYPEGFTAGIGLEDKDFDTSFTFQYSQDVLDFSQFAFRSDYISLGSVAYSGILSNLKGNGLSFYDSDDPNRSIIDPDGNPKTNLGLIFSTPYAPLGLSAFRRIDYSGVLFWFEPPILSRGTLLLSQSFSTDEDKVVDDSWYLDERAILSAVQMHSLASLMLGDEYLFGGGTLILNWSREDRGGFSFLLLGGFFFSFIACQSELLWSSPSYVDIDLDSADFPLIWKTRFSFSDLPFLMESVFYFQFGKDSLPWYNRVFIFENGNRIEYPIGRHFIEGDFDWALIRSDIGEWHRQVTLDLCYRSEVVPFYWEYGIRGNYGDGIFRYLLSLSAGVDRKPFEGEASLSLEIEKKLLLSGGVSFVYTTDNYALSGEIELLDLGIYNAGDVQFKPSFSLELKVNQHISP